jgi:hypothetical protein
MNETLALLDWRRRVFALYAEVRDQLPTDPAAAQEHWRAVRAQLFGHHPQSPLEEGERSDALPAYFPYDPSFAVVADVDTDVEPERYDIEMSGGSGMAFVRFASAATPWGSLDVYWLDAYGGGMFVPFRDATAGSTTYGGGRYLLDTVKGADLGSTPSGQLVLDFNFAYHPSCYYSPLWSCPLAPPGNRLDVAIEAGERSRLTP